MKQLLTVCVLLLAACLQVQGQACEGVRVEPNLPDFNHDVSGVLYIENITSYCIENFFYDGAGPDAFLYLYLPGDPPFIKGGGVITPVPGREDIRSGQFEVGRRYMGERLRFDVPEGHRTCDYGAFGIWCRYASQLFTAVTSMERYFNSTHDDDGTIMCTRSPGRAFLGSLPTDNNEISGDVFAVSDKQFTIRNFTYDGAGGENVRFYFFPAGETASPSSTTGISLDVSVAASDALELIFPDDMDMYSCDYGTIVLWDGNSANDFLASITIDLSTAFTNNQALADHDRSLVFCDRPTTRPGVLVGALSTDSHGLEGTLYVQDDKTLYIQLFSYDAGGEDVYLYYYRQGQQVEDSGHGYRIGLSASVQQLPGGLSNSYKRITPFVVDLNNALDEDDVNTCDLGWFTIWSEATQEHFTRIQLPTDIYTDDSSDPEIAARTSILCSQTTAIPTPRAGGATPTVSLISGLTLSFITMVALLLKA